MPIDIQKEKARRERYENSDKAKERKKRWREKNQSEIMKKRKEKEELERQGRLGAFCRHWTLDIGVMNHYMELKKNGVDIWARDAKYAKFIQIFQTGIYPQEMRISMVAKYRTVPGTDQLSFPKQDPPWKVLQEYKRRNPSVGSIDYY